MAAQGAPSPAELRQRLARQLVTEAFVQTFPDGFAQRVAQRQAFLAKHLQARCAAALGGATPAAPDDEAGGDDAARRGSDLIAADAVAALEAFDARSPEWSAASARLRWRLSAALEPQIGASIRAALERPGAGLHSSGSLGWSWDASACGANIAVESGGTVVTLGERSGQTTEGARGTHGWSTGVHRWTVEWLNDVGTHSSVGVCTAAHAVYVERFDHAIGNDAVSWGWHSKGGNILHDASTLGTCEAWGQGDQIECILDCDGGTLTFAKNGEAQDAVVTGLGGLVLFPCVATPWYKGSMRLIATSDGGADDGDGAGASDATAVGAVVPQSWRTLSPGAPGSESALNALHGLLERLVAHVGAAGAAEDSGAAYVDLEAVDVRGEAAATAVAIMRALEARGSARAPQSASLSRFAVGSDALETVLGVAACADRVKAATSERMRNASALLLLGAMTAEQKSDGGEASSLPPAPPGSATGGANSSAIGSANGDAPAIATHSVEMQRVIAPRVGEVVDASSAAFAGTWHRRCVAICAERHCAAWGADAAQASEALRTILDVREGGSTRVRVLLQHSAAHALTAETAFERVHESGDAGAGASRIRWQFDDRVTATLRFASGVDCDACLADLEAARASADALGQLDIAAPLVAAQQEALKVGDRVRVRADVGSPAFGWGSVTHASVGFISSVSGDRTTIDYPSNSAWNGSVPEMERIPVSEGIAVGDVVRIPGPSFLSFVCSFLHFFCLLTYSFVYSSTCVCITASTERGVVRSIRSGRARVDFPRRPDTKVRVDELENANTGSDPIGAAASVNARACDAPVAVEFIARLCLGSATRDLTRGASDAPRFAAFIGQLLSLADASLLAREPSPVAPFALSCLDAILNLVLGFICYPDASKVPPIATIADGLHDALAGLQRTLRERDVADGDAVAKALTRNASRLVGETLAAIGGRLASAGVGESSSIGASSASDGGGGAGEAADRELCSWLASKLLAGGLREEAASVAEGSELYFLAQLGRPEGCEIRVALEAVMGPDKALRKRIKKKAFRKEPRSKSVYFVAQAALLYATGTSREASQLTRAHIEGGSGSARPSPSPELKETWLYSASILKRFEQRESLPDSFFAAALDRARLIMDTVQTWRQIKPGLQRQMSAALHELEEEPVDVTDALSSASASALSSASASASGSAASPAVKPSPLRVMLSDETSLDAEHTRFYLSLWQQLGESGGASKTIGYRGATRSTIQGSVISFIFAQNADAAAIRVEMARRATHAETRVRGLRICTAALSELRLLGQPLATLDFARALNLLHFGAYAIRSGDVRLIPHYTTGLEGTGARVAEMLRASFAAMQMEIALHLESDVPWVARALDLAGEDGIVVGRAFLHAACNARLHLIALCAAELYPQDQSLPVETSLLRVLKKQGAQLTAADEARRRALQMHQLAAQQDKSRAAKGAPLAWDATVSGSDPASIAVEEHGLLIAQSTASEASAKFTGICSTSW